MSKLEQIKLKLAAMLSAAVKFSTIKTDKAVIEWNGEEDLKAGDEVFVTNENGERVAVADGEYVTEDGKVITVAGGKVESIVDTKAEVDEDEKIENVDAAEEEKPEEKPEAEPTEIEKIREEINELYKLVDSILDKIGETRDEADARFKKIEKMSAAKPAEVEFANATSNKSTGDAKIDRLRNMNKDWRSM